jgi:hypothetical protein
MAALVGGRGADLEEVVLDAAWDGDPQQLGSLVRGPETGAGAGTLGDERSN